MFPNAIFPTSFFPPNYWPKTGAVVKRGGTWVAGAKRHILEEMRARQIRQDVRMRLEVVSLLDRLKKKSIELEQTKRRDKAIFALLVSEI